MFGEGRVSKSLLNIKTCWRLALFLRLKAAATRIRHHKQQQQINNGIAQIKSEQVNKKKINEWLF